MTILPSCLRADAEALHDDMPVRIDAVLPRVLANLNLTRANLNLTRDGLSSTRAGLSSTRAGESHTPATLLLSSLPHDAHAPLDSSPRI